MKTKDTQPPVWSLLPREVMESLETSESGLSADEVKKRLEEHGKNDLSEKGQRHAFSIFLSQFTSPLILILIVAAIVSFFVGEHVDAIVIIAIVLMSAILGFFQEYKAERALRSLKKYISIKVKVIRHGAIEEVDSREIVPGDIVHLNIGDMVPADMRIFHMDEFSTNEASLTGESLPVSKTTDVIALEKKVPQDLLNMAFMGTSVASGLGEGIVTATAGDTFLGKTAAYLKAKNPDTEFHKGIKEFGNLLMKITFAMTLFILIANAALGKSFFDSLLFAIALAVGITPEVLPILITITLSTGALKMAKEKVITKTLAAVEDLGNMDTLCCDKTGTLTVGELGLSDFHDFDGKENEQLVVHGLLCNSGEVRKGKRSFGNVVDKALWASEKVADAREKIKDFKILDKNEFDFERRRMSVVAKDGAGIVFIAKGAPESIWEVCTTVRTNGKDEKISSASAAKFKSLVEKYENDGFRIIAVAEKKYAGDDSHKKDEKDLTFLGFLLFLDPPKSTIKESLIVLQKLGVNVKVISGDSPGVTRNICNKVGLKIALDRVVTGAELDDLNEKEFEHYAKIYNVFARVTPEQKYRIVAKISKEDHVVGFLGDGINDAPALKVADVGISVDNAAGIAKEAADIILLKKSLAVITDGIVSGRKIFGNITKYILNTISANFGNMFTVAASSLFLKFIPLLPSQILFNNFVSDAPLLTIATDNVDEELVKKPKKWNIKLISKFMVVFGLISTIFDLALILPLIFIMKTGPELFRTAWFVESSLSEMIITFAIRTKLPFFKSRPSKWLVWTTVITIFATIGITYMSIGATLFEFVKMPTTILLFIGGILVSYFLAAEIAKRYFFKKFDL